MDKFREECGLIGIWNHKEAANLAYLGLYAQQHRGQEGAGVVTLDSCVEPPLAGHRGLGLVSDVFSGFDFSALPGSNAIGHVRYTTAGTSSLANVQPFYAQVALGTVAIAHNGNLVNADALRDELIRDGAIFSSSSDTEIILHLIARAPRRGATKSEEVIEAVISSLKRVHGAYSLLVLTQESLLAVRDPNGFRPLSIGRLDGSLVVASESCAFDLIDASFIRDIEPGELVEISRNGEVRSYYPFPTVRPTPCIFEYVYFSRPDSNVFGRNVYAVRRRLGCELAKECPVRADLVVPVPDSGVMAAMGYADEAGIPLEFGLIRNHYVGRTFIEPKQAIRDFGVKIKLNTNRNLLRGKSVVIIDDSIVRGTTSRKLVKMIREAGAREIHFRVSSPPTISPCFYGIDTPLREELIASRLSLEEIAQYLGVDSLAYLSVAGLYRAVGEDSSAESAPGAGQRRFCDACFSGHYPVGTPADFSKRQTELFGPVAPRPEGR